MDVIMTEKKLTLYMGNDAPVYKMKLETIGKRLIHKGIDVADKRKGGVSVSAVVRYLIDKTINEETKS